MFKKSTIQKHARFQRGFKTFLLYGKTRECPFEIAHPEIVIFFHCFFHHWTKGGCCSSQPGLHLMHVQEGNLDTDWLNDSHTRKAVDKAPLSQATLFQENR
jgi:hypothetical protein